MNKFYSLLSYCLSFYHFIIQYHITQQQFQNERKN